MYWYVHSSQVFSLLCRYVPGDIWLMTALVDHWWHSLVAMHTSYLAHCGLKLRMLALLLLNNRLCKDINRWFWAWQHAWLYPLRYCAHMDCCTRHIMKEPRHAEWVAFQQLPASMDQGQPLQRSLKWLVAFCWTSIFQRLNQRFIPICLYIPTPLVAGLYSFVKHACLYTTTKSFLQTCRSLFSYVTGHTWGLSSCVLCCPSLCLLV